MSNLIHRFVAARATAKPQPVVNAGDTVTRADFDKLALLVNAMSKAVEGLIEDIEAITSPEKMQGVFNAAIKEVMPTINAARNFRPPLSLPADRSALAPKASDDATVVANGKGLRPPLALKADRTFLAPKGE